MVNARAVKNPVQLQENVVQKYIAIEYLDKLNVDQNRIIKFSIGLPSKQIV